MCLVLIFGFVSLFLGLGLCLCLGLCVKCQGNIWQDPRAPPPPSATPTSVAINLYPFFFLSLSLSFGLVLCLFGFWSIYGLGFLMWYKDLVIFYLGLKWGLGMIICRFVGTFWFRVCLKMVLIGDFVSVCIWICVWLVIWDDFWGFQVLEFVWLSVYVCVLWDGASV